MRFVYFVTRGTGDPTNASLPLHLAVNGSVVVGHETAIVLAGDSTEIVVGDHAEHMEGLGVPPMRDLLAKIREHAVPVYV